MDILNLSADVPESTKESDEKSFNSFLADYKRVRHMLPFDILEGTLTVLPTDAAAVPVADEITADVEAEGKPDKHTCFTITCAEFDVEPEVNHAVAVESTVKAVYGMVVENDYSEYDHVRVHGKRRLMVDVEWETELRELQEAENFLERGPPDVAANDPLGAIVNVNKSLLVCLLLQETITAQEFFTNVCIGGPHTTDTATLKLHEMIEKVVVHKLPLSNFIRDVSREPRRYCTRRQGLGLE